MEILQTPDLKVTGSALEKYYPGHPQLAACEYRATRVPSCYDYRKMVDLCCDTAAPLLNRLYRLNYAAWLLLVSAPFDAERKARYPNFSLSQAAREAALVEVEGLEQSFTNNDDLQRTVGIYQIAPRFLADAVLFCTKHSWSLILMSNREAFGSSSNLAVLYEATTADVPSRSLLAMNWEMVALKLCPQQDIVLKTWGGSDDLYREMMFISLPEILI